MDLATLRISLNDTNVYRIVELPHEVSLNALHRVVQFAFGWEDMHLHSFTSPAMKGVEWTNYISEPERQRDDSTEFLHVLAPKVGDRLTYVYDFGDWWEHTIEVVELQPGKAQGPWTLGLHEHWFEPIRIISGVGMCPPEDFGGPGIWTDFLKWSAGAQVEHKMFEERMEFFFPDYRRQDIAEIATLPIRGIEQYLPLGPAFDARHDYFLPLDESLPLAEFVATGQLWNLQRIVAEAWQSWLDPDEMASPRELLEVIYFFLDLVGEGAKLTSAGYLPTSIVTELEQWGSEHGQDWISTGRRKAPFSERDVARAGWLRELLCDAGILKIQKKMIVPVKSAQKKAQDPEWLLERILRTIARNNHPIETGLELSTYIMYVSYGDMWPNQFVPTFSHIIGDMDLAVRDMHQRYLDYLHNFMALGYVEKDQRWRSALVRMCHMVDEDLKKPD
ncbi:plasmid pRiA4b ORF-3 family protein [Corynebacterium hindlerae]|uniref:Plasmid pRiA4b ORF-3 family protein n=1 Tax=Corynebacterium hindlerae TaxID=699041 RepID=A0A7G5FCF3_9CORY|nr:plasmid pRiA4b ORF-3 family protein [Corynebacterium hindlerae]QMV84294.1 plasmid pRiA4b ORF-3 family protein [Corynebacterium hindlerae]